MSVAFRVSASMVFVAALLSAACVGQSAPRGSQPPAPRFAPPGSEYFLGTWAGSGFSAQLHLARQAPSASGVSTVSVGVSIVPDAATVRSQVQLLGATGHELAVSALTPTGATDLGGTPARLALSRREGLSQEELEGAFAVPGNTESIRLTIHLGLNTPAAKEGTSVVVPLSAIPVVERPQRFFSSSYME